MVEQDYDPVADQGAIERVPRVVSLIRRGPDLQPLRPGQQRVVLDAHGHVIGTEDVAAEQGWAGAARWVAVDMAPHLLEYAIAHQARDGSAGYLITVRVMVHVLSAEEVVRRSVHTVSPYVLPGLLSRIDQALPPDQEQVYSASADNPVGALDGRRDQVTALVRRSLPPERKFKLDDWLEVRVVEVVVAFDELTEARYRQLLKLRTDQELAAASNRVKDTVVNRLDTRLATREGRAAELVATNPENLEKVVADLNSSDGERRLEGVELVKHLIESNIIQNLQDIRTVVSMMNGSDTGQPSTSELAGATPARELENPAQGAVDENGRPAETNEDQEW